jgi:hypothetical protein
MHQARLRARSLADHPRSYPQDPGVRVDDTDTYQLQAAASDLEALALHQQARHLAEVQATLAELYRRDGVQVSDAELDAQADQLALAERGDRFLKDVATRLQPDSELLALARQVDDHGLGVWREAAGSLVDDCPPSLAQLRCGVEEEQRAELRSHAHLLRREAQLGALLGRKRVVGRWWRRRWDGELAGQLVDCRRRREQSQRCLAYLNAKLLVIDNTEQARAAWITQAREALVRGVAAAQVLAERQHQPDQGDGRGPSDRAVGRIMTDRKGPGRRCSWSHCSAPAVATVAFKLPNLLAGSRRDYCAEHTRQVCLAKGTSVVARFAARRRPIRSGLDDAGPGRLAEPTVPSRRKGVVP